jgi:flagellar biosynthesis/type III secretory pathway protein FliH
MGRLVKGAGLAAKAGERERAPADREAGLAEVTELLVSARADAEAVRSQAADSALVLARRMAEKIVGHAVDVDPAVMADIVGQALAASRARAGAVTVRVHPDDLAAVEQSRARWNAGAAVVRVVADGAVGRYGCVVDTPVGRVNARLDAQLAALERALVRRSDP